MGIQVINNVEVTDVKHEAPRIITIKSCDKYLPSLTSDKYIELEVDNMIYRVVASDLIAAVENATNAR